MGVSIWEGNKAQGMIDVGHLMVEGIARQNLLLAQILQTGESTPAAELAEIHRIVQSGEAPNIFSIGEQLMLNYNDGTQSYVLPWDIVHFGNVELQDGEVVPGMYLQSHYAMQGVQFDASEAIYVASAAMPAGTYYFTIGTNWGSHCHAGTSYSFTTTKEIPTGGQIVVGKNNDFYTWGAPDVAPENWRVHTFSNATSITPLDTNLVLTVGNTGTDLGTVASNIAYGNTNPNNLQRAVYGYNRWSQSGMRQWLNSGAAAGTWWTAKNEFDRPPQQFSSVRGFMAGFDDAFLNIIKPVKVTTALNTVTDSAIGTTEDTYDTFFPASLEQEYIVPQLANAEGEYWEYWKQRLGLSSPQAQGGAGANAMHIRYAYNAKTSAQYVRLRSAYRGYASYTWNVRTAGNAGNSYATYASRPAPACVIC